MTSTTPRGSRRHGKPKSAAGSALDRLIDRIGPRRFTAAAALLGAVTMSLALLAGFRLTGGSGEQPDRPAARATTSISPAAADSELGAEEEPGDYFKDKDPEHAEHVKDVVWSGDFFRVYTDLDEGDTDHPSAMALCEWSVEYVGDDTTVFVHAKKNENGNVVLVNTVSGGCRVVK